MQAQFYPPERPSRSSSSSNRQTVNPEVRPVQKQRLQGRQRQGKRLALNAELLATARSGNFQAIATVLNNILKPHHISAWVGEAGPGYLQITLTVKRPPKRQPLIKLVSHQLCSLKSDVVLGANLTVQVAQTNLILWNQLVRLPLPDIYKQPSKLEVWREQLKEWQQQAKVKTAEAWTMGQQKVEEWSRSKTQENERPEHQKEVVQQPSNHHHSYDLSVQSKPIKAESTGSIPLEILQQAQEHASQIEQGQRLAHNQTQTPQAQAIQSQATQSLDSLVKLLQTVYQTPSSQEDNQSPENTQAKAPPLDQQPAQQPQPSTNMTPNVVIEPFMSPNVANPAVAPNGPTGDFDLDDGTVGPFNTPAFGGGDGFGNSFGNSFGKGFGQLQAKVMDQLMNPSPWMLGGAAIAAFLVGSALMDSVSEDNSSQDNRAPIGQQKDLAQPDRSTGEDFSANSDRSDRLSNATIDESASKSVSLSVDNNTTADAANNDVVADSSVSSASFSRPISRPKTVEMGDQTIDVVPLLPTTSSLSEVTVTFTGKAIVPLPPPDAETKPKGWRSLFSLPPAPMPSHPADIAMALINTPVSGVVNSAESDAASILPIQDLRQGGIDVVNIAGSDIAKSQKPSLKETVRSLNRSAIRAVGAGLTEEDASRPQIFDVKGHRIAILGYVDTHLFAADQDMAGNNPGSRRRLAADIDEIRDQVDWVIVSYHWSNIDATTSAAPPTEQQVRLAHLAVDEGADLVVGYHPDVIQGGEIYNGRAIAYSIGQIPLSMSNTDIHEGAVTNPGSANPNNNVLDTVPHQLPESGIRTSPARSDGQTDGGIDGPLTSKEAANHTMATMVKVILGDRHMGVEFVPVYTRAGLSEFVEGRDQQLVLRALKESSRSFDKPLLPKGVAHLNLEQNIRAFPNSAGESFQSEQTEAFIERAE
ncbi:MAG: CapA family protein [Cyanobacteria bacterium P01_F01_bin.150]